MFRVRLHMYWERCVRTTGSNGRSSLTLLYQPLCVRTSWRCYCCCIAHIIIPSFFCVTFVFLFRCDRASRIIIIIVMRRSMRCRHHCHYALCAGNTSRWPSSCSKKGYGHGDDVDDAREMRIRKRNNARWRGKQWPCIRRHTINSQECFENVVNAPSVLPG